MPELLVDSSVFIDYLRADRRAHSFIAGARGTASVVMHGVVAAEIISGARNRTEQRRAMLLVSTCESIMPDESDLRRSLKLLERHCLGDGVEWLDCLIAATALRLKCPVATLNEKHFRVFNGLKVMRPY
jgi:predicted nucleic acid-binding protein